MHKFSKETLDIPKDFIADVSNEKNRTYYYHRNGGKDGTRSVNIRENTEGGDIRQSFVFAKNFSFSQGYSSNNVGDNLMGFVTSVRFFERT